MAGIREADEASVRVSVLGQFGMLNWLYTWCCPGADPGPEDLAAEFIRISLHGLPSSAPARAD